MDFCDLEKTESLEKRVDENICGRPVIVRKKEGRLIHIGLGYEWPDGKTCMQVSKFFVEIEKGNVIDCYPSEVKFIKPDPLADGSGNQTTHNQ